MKTKFTECRAGCAACCTVISISSALPGMPEGKPAGVRCINLDERNFCRLHGTPQYPKICASFPAEAEMCGDSNEHAYAFIRNMEEFTKN